MRNTGDPRIGVTNNESADSKHLVQPYSDAPTVDDGSGRACAFCGNNGFRRSRVRLTDFPRLLTLKYPVRCIRCGQRQFVPFAVASAALPAKQHTLGPSPDKPGSWREFTADAPGSPLQVRPAITAAEPVAERLDDAFKPGPPARLGLSNEASPNEALPPAPQRPHSTPPATPAGNDVPSPAQSTPPAYTPSRRGYDNGIW